MRAGFPFLDWPHPIPFAHRGGAAEVGGENTLAAFGRAVAMGYRYLETDGRVTSDGVLLAFHDERLDRVTDLEGRLEDRPWAEVRQARVGPEGEAISTMEALLDAFPDARFNIDPKMDAAVAPLAEALRRTNAWDRVNIAAFPVDQLDAIIINAAGCGAMLKDYAHLLGGDAAGRFVDKVKDVSEFLVALGPVAPTNPLPMTVTYHDACHLCHAQQVRRAIPVHVWTIDEPAEIHRLLDLGAGGIMTDRPSVLKNVLEERGQWVS